MTGCPSWCQPHAWDAVSNSSKYNILAGTQIQLYKFVCTIATQNSNINFYAVNFPLVAFYDIPGQRQLCYFTPTAQDV